MSYVNDIFISYRRERNWTPWTRDHFKSLLHSYLQSDLGRAPSIFIDERLEENFGEDWVVDLATQLAQSRISVVVFSLDYFSSDWCLHELDLMLARAKCIAPPYANPIVPVIGHDGDRIPHMVKRLTSCDVKQFRIADICKGTPKYQDFSERIKALSPSIAKAVQAAAPYDDLWREACINRFNAVYAAQLRGDHLKTEEFDPEQATPPATNPRLIIS